MAQKKKPEEEEIPDSLTKATEKPELPPDNPADAVRKQEEDKQEEPKKKTDERISQYEGKFWRSWLHITGYGEVRGGKATKEQLAAFINGMGPDTNLDDWLSDKDEVAAYIKANTMPRNPRT